MKDDLFYLLHDYWHFIFYGAALVFAALSAYELKNYRKEHVSTKKFIDRCISCKAEVIRPVVMDFNYRELVKSAADIAENLDFIPISFHQTSECVNTEVRYIANGRTIETIIKRRASVQHPKVGSQISILYDPLLPQHGFSEDIKQLIMNRQLKSCITNIILMFLFLLCGIFWHLSPLL